MSESKLFSPSFLHQPLPLTHHALQEAVDGKWYFNAQKRSSIVICDVTSLAYAFGESP